jgi:hypothetical protein
MIHCIDIPNEEIKMAIQVMMDDSRSAAAQQFLVGLPCKMEKSCRDESAMICILIWSVDTVTSISEA